MSKNILTILAALILLVAAILIFTPKTGNQSPVLNEQNSNTTEETRSAKSLAEGKSTYQEFSQQGYESALQADKIVYLEFYANWCPICRAQEPELVEGIKRLERNDIAGFRVNYKDDQTNEFEKALAEKYEIPYQHHKIVLKDGEVVINSAESWDAQTLVGELTKL